MFVVDDAVIAIAIEQAAAAAAAASAEAAAAGAGAAASTAAAEAAAAGAAEASMASAAEAAAAETAATGAGEAAAGEAAATGATEGTIADSLTQAATGAEAEITGNAAAQPAVESAVTQAAPAAMEPATTSAVEPAASSAVEPAATQPAITPEASAPVDNVGANMDPTLTEQVPGSQGPMPEVSGPPEAAGPGAGTGTGGQSITDQLMQYGKDLGNEMMKPKTLIPAAMSAGSAGWQSYETGKEQDRINAANAEAMDRVRANGDKVNAAVNKWASENLSPTAMRANTDEAYNDLTASYDQFLAASNRDGAGPAGNMSADYTKAMADGMTGASQKAADYARKLAKTQAPAFANLKSNLGELIMQRDVGSALSDSASAAAIAKAAGAPQGSAGQLGAAALRGLGQGLGSKM